MNKIFRPLVSCLIFVIGFSALLGQDIVSMVKKVKPCVVTVIPQNAFGLDEGYGSGFFIDKNRIVTNYHVIDGTSGVKIILNDSTILKAKHIIAQDSLHDVAILEIDVPATRRVNFLTTVTRYPEQGERIYVVGNPMGLEQSISDGIVSSVRPVKDFGKQIQFTAAISPGNSGSPLMDANGTVYGVVSYHLRGGQNLNFAVPFEFVTNLKMGKPIDFIPTEKEYDGVKMKVADAFEVDTTLIGTPPSNLSRKEQNIWRLRNAALRYRWDAEIIDRNMNRMIRAIKRNFEKFDIEKDTLTMDQAHTLISESLGENSENEKYSPEVTSKIEGLKMGLGVMAARMYLKSDLKPITATAGSISKRAQIWQEFYEGKHYSVLSLTDTADIEDLDVAIFYLEDGKWKPVASDTKKTAYPIASFKAPKSAEYAIVWRIAKRKTPETDGVFGTMVIKSDDED